MPDVRTQLRALDVFRVFARVRRPLRLTELAREMDIAVSSCFAIVRALLENGYLYERNERGGYYPTDLIHAHARAISEHDPVREIIGSVLARLREETGETTVLGKAAGTKSVYVLVYESLNNMRLASVQGAMRPLYANAMGKALLSEMHPEARGQLLRGVKMKQVTGNTITSPEKLETQIVRMKKRGWFSSEGENAEGASGIAVPLRLGRTVYALYLGGPAERMRDHLDRNVKALQTARDEIIEVASMSA